MPNNCDDSATHKKGVGLMDRFSHERWLDLFGDDYSYDPDYCHTGDRHWQFCDCPDCVELQRPVEFHRTNFQTGNIVKWKDELHIVAKIYDDHLVLLPFDYANTSAHPSTMWPRDPSERVSSVQMVAMTLSDFILQRVRKAILEV